MITGAADDDPSGISTYSVAGAAYGYATLWIALLTFPLMAAIQLMCARLGMVTGRGLAAAVRIYYPRWVLWGACSILVVANVINIGADLGGMAEATQLITGIRSLIWIPVYAFFILGLLFWASYKLIARIFKWLTLVLFAYVFASFYAHVDWRHALAVTFVPHLEWSRGFLAVLVAILGTTISPYLFFWQAAEEVEEGRTKGRTLAERKGATAGELRSARADTIAGMFFSNLIMYFIILTTAATLHAHGQTDITTARRGRRSVASTCRQWGLPALHPGLDRHRNVGRAGPRGIMRLCGGGRSSVAWLNGRQAKKRAQVLRSNGRCDGVGPRAELLGFQRGENAVLVGGNQWPPGAASDPARHPPDQQPQSNGQARELAAAQVFRLGYLRCHDCGSGRNDHYVLKVSDGESKCWK